uniref:Methylated-DNA--protein-cysteine methyltransferase n=3 Tax=Molossus molossus TaxID=27622 RepID=A0A7J8DQP0_MOLMO|nr:O-6-methylguanine-DNA methyltransferase [Molossus molossus]
MLAVGALGKAVRGRMDGPCDVRCATVASPVGQIQISGCEQGLHGLRLLGRKTPDAGPAEAPCPAEPPGSPEETVEPLMECAAWLDAYFHEPSALQELPVPALHHPVFLQDSFTGQVLWKLLKEVKFGEVVSYQQLAALVGSPKAARAVGGAMRNNPIPILIPCHRVVRSSGAVGSYSGGLGVKEWLLDHEGSLEGTPARAGGSRPARTGTGP